MPPSYPRGTPSIACIGVIGRQNQPLHITIFPTTPSAPPRQPADYHWHLLSSLDVLRVRFSDPGTGPPANGDFGLLFAVDERIAVYGFVSPTGVRFIVILDMEGKAAPERESLEGGRDKVWNMPGSAHGQGIRDADVRPVFRALHRAYVGLLRNPFFEPDECEPGNVDVVDGEKRGMIESKVFDRAVSRIGETWFPGIGVL